MTTTTAPRLTAPRITTPNDGAYVDASAAHFAWRPVPGATGYLLQIGTDAAFGGDVLEVDAEAATELTVFGTLPPKEQALWWRVRAETETGVTAWSEPATFVPAGDEALDAFNARAEAATLETKKASERERIAGSTETTTAENYVPWHLREDHADPRGGMIAAAVMGVAFAIMMGVIAFVTL